jgi:hypothetical protein
MQAAFALQQKGFIQYYYSLFRGKLHFILTPCCLSNYNFAGDPVPGIFVPVGQDLRLCKDIATK